VNPAIQALFRHLKKLCSMLLGLKLDRTKPYIEILTAIALVYFAYSTDTVYHKLALIAETQYRIIDSQNQPLFRITVRHNSDENGKPLDYGISEIYIDNSGAPAFNIGLTIDTVLYVKYNRSISVDKTGCSTETDHTIKILVLNYFIAGSMIFPGSGLSPGENKKQEIVSDESILSGRIYNIHSVERENELKDEINHTLIDYKGNKKFISSGSFCPAIDISLLHFLKISYNDISNKYHFQIYMISSDKINRIDDEDLKAIYADLYDAWTRRMLIDIEQIKHGYLLRLVQQSE